MNRKKLRAVAAGLALIGGCCLAMIVYPLLKGEDIFNPAPTADEVGEAFLSALKADEYQAAFALCGEDLQRELINADNLRYEIEKYQIQPENWVFDSRRLSVDQVELSGPADFRFHPGGTFQLTLRRYDKEWKIAVFYLGYN